MKYGFTGILAYAVLAGSAAAQNVTTYHNSNNRHGAYVVPGLTTQAAASIRFAPGFSATVSGNMYAQPLYWAPKGSTPAVIAFTENNIAYALNASTGAALWSTQLAAPAQLQNLPCGNVNPEGITGTPVIDPATGTVYLNALTAGTNNAARQYVYALSLKTGAVQTGWPVDMTAALATKGITFDSTIQGQRSALLFFGGKIYVTYGGKAGDCGSYHGTVVEMDPASAAITGFWATTATKGGIWAQAGIASQGKSLFVTTGNTSGATNWGEGEAIIRLRAGLAQSSKKADYFSPANWHTLDSEDADLGGTMAVPINAPYNGTEAPRMLALGKDGNGYLVARNYLGGIGGKAFMLPLANSSIITAAAVYATPSVTLVSFTASSPKVCSGSGLVTLNVAGGGTTPITTAWCAAFNGRGAPIVTTTDGTSSPIVWVTGAEGDNELHAFDGLTGASVFSGTGTTMTGLHHFSTLMAAGGKLYVGADNTVYAFSFTQ
jgi:hypothetical protein